jgi:hypothetical protein
MVSDTCSDEAHLVEITKVNGSWAADEVLEAICFTEAHLPQTQNSSPERTRGNKVPSPSSSARGAQLRRRSDQPLGQL